MPCREPADAAGRRDRKQELSRQIPQALKDAQRLATILRKGLQQHFGPAADRLAEFGIKPFRGIKRQAPAPDPGAPTPPPPPATE